MVPIALIRIPDLCHCRYLMIPSIGPTALKEAHSIAEQLSDAQSKRTMRRIAGDRLAEHAKRRAYAKKESSKSR
jgi:hypothetical protein